MRRVGAEKGAGGCTARDCGERQVDRSDKGIACTLCAIVSLAQASSSTFTGCATINSHFITLRTIPGKCAAQWSHHMRQGSFMEACTQSVPGSCTAACVQQLHMNPPDHHDELNLHVHNLTHLHRHTHIHTHTPRRPRHYQTCHWNPAERCGGRDVARCLRSFYPAVPVPRLDFY